MVFIPDADRGTLCVSSQVGCTLNCRFCHTGTMQLVRNLEPAEIVGQVMLARDALGEWPSQPEGRMLTNIVMMGMGEPLYNFDNVRDALKIVMDGDGLGLSKRRITLSTSGVVPMMERAGEEIGVNLAVSLHAVTKEVRDEIVPLNRKYGIDQLLEACAAYPGANNARRITFEYVMLKDKNDSDDDARELVRLIRQYRLPAKVNLIPFNPWPGAAYECSTPERINSFQQHRLRSRHFRAGSHPARPRHRRRLRPAEDCRGAQAQSARSRLTQLPPSSRRGSAPQSRRCHGVDRAFHRTNPAGWQDHPRQPDGSKETYGPGGGKHVTVRLHDASVCAGALRNPRLAWRAYMDGRVTIEDGTMLDLLELIVGAKPWEQGKRKALGKGKSKWLKRFFRRNDPVKSRHNVAHHYDIGNQALRALPRSRPAIQLRLFHRSRRTPSSRRRRTRRRTSPPSST